MARTEPECSMPRPKPSHFFGCGRPMRQASYARRRPYKFTADGELEDPYPLTEEFGDPGYRLQQYSSRDLRWKISID